MTREEFLSQIRFLKDIYIIYSNNTRVPYVECDSETFDDTAYCFTDEDLANEKCTQLNMKNHNVKVSKISNEILPSALAGLIFYGFNAISFTTKEDTYIYQIREIIKEPVSDDPNRPLLINPNLNITMIYFMQELRQGNIKDKQEQLKELEEEMLVNVTRSRFLLPFVQSKDEDGKELRSLITLKLENEQKIIPMFTDRTELARFTKGENYNVVVLEFNQILDFPVPEDSTAFIINPASVGVIISHNWLANMRENRDKNKENTNNE